MAVIFAAHTWKSNANLIVACRDLGYLHKDWKILDATYGRGKWWTEWEPKGLHKHDLALDGTDFRDLSSLYDDDTFDAVAYDPPYTPRGGDTSSSKMKDFNERYGRVTNTTPASIQQLIEDGLTEMVRVAKPKGYVLVKVQDYIWGGKLRLGTHNTITHGLTLGCELVDRLEFITSPRPQPARTRADGKPSVQQHARRNLSTMLVFQLP